MFDLCKKGRCPDHGTCECCGGPLDCEEARAGNCDGCWQARDEAGDE